MTSKINKYRNFYEKFMHATMACQKFKIHIANHNTQLATHLQTSWSLPMDMFLYISHDWCGVNRNSLFLSLTRSWTKELIFKYLTVHSQTKSKT